MRKSMVGLVAVLTVAGAGLAGIGSTATAASTEPAQQCPVPLPQGAEDVALDPANFVERVDHPYWPMSPGSKWVSRESDIKGNDAKVRVTVITRTKAIQAIDATVVHDTLSTGGELVENTFDWYAQDTCGNVWYLGENTREYEGGQVVSRAGSWQAGVDGAQAGVALPADPEVGLTYRQEYYAGQAEDVGQVLSLSEQGRVPAGHYRDLLLTKDTTTLKRQVLEYKFYAKGIGPVLAIGISGGSDREELLRFHEPPA